MLLVLAPVFPIGVSDSSHQFCTTFHIDLAVNIKNLKMHKSSTVMSSISSFESIGNESFPNEPSQTPVPPLPFDIYAAYQRFLRDEEV